MEHVAFILLYVLLGSVIGLIAGFLGGGGGSVVTPALIYTFTFLGYPEDPLAHTAVGTSLFVIMCAALSSSLVHIRKKVIIGDVFLFLVFSGAIGAWIGGALSSHISGAIFIKIFAVALMIIAWWIYQGEREREIKASEVQEKSKSFREEKRYLFLLTAIPTGFLTGFVSAFFGVGGAIIMLPAAIFILRFSLIEAISHSASLMVVTALFGVLSYGYYGLQADNPIPYCIGYVNYVVGVVMALSAVILSRWGAKKIHAVDHRKVTKMLSVFLFIAAIGLLLK
jgi:uncharacterized membrane protein YfcA